MTFLLLLLLPPAEAGKPDRVAAARAVREAVVAAARENARGAEPRQGDELTGLLVRAAAAAALKLPPADQAPGFLLGVGVGLDPSDLMRKNPATASLWKQIESADERGERLRVLGTPTVHGRHDLAQHFGVSAALTAALGAKQAEAAGILKEVLDSNGGSGFSFADLAADLAGVALGEWVTADPARLGRIAKDFRVREFVPPVKGLAEDLTAEEFARRYGSVSDARFRKILGELRERARGMAGLATKEPSGR